MKGVAIAKPKTETIQGTIDRVVFHNQKNGYCVLNVSINSLNGMVAVGYMPNIREGDTFKFTGAWKKHPQYGKQFHFTEYELILPQTRIGIINYLSSIAYGIGPVKAAKIVDALGESTLEIIQTNPNRLRQLDFIKPEQAEEIISKFNENKVLAELTSMICRQGITPKLAAKIYKVYGSESIKVVKENPYILADDMFGVGFKIADRIAQATGIAPNSPFRVEAAVEFALKEAANEGHMYLPPQALVKKVKELLGRGCGVSGKDIKKAAENQAAKEKVKIENNCVYHSSLYKNECELATRLKMLAKQKQREIKDIDGLIKRIEDRLGIKYADQQKKAIKTALTSPVSIITGGPGTGKTTITNAIVDIYKSIHRYPIIYLASPTGRAAKRLSESTNMEAKTIHRLLHYHPEGGFEYNTANPLPSGLLIVDEFSMTDIELSSYLFDAVENDMQVVMVGDVEQLPSVGPGSVLRDCIMSRVIPTIKLKYNYRQAVGSTIADIAHQIVEGIVPELVETDDLKPIAFDDPENGLRIVKSIVGQLQKEKAGIMDFQVLTPMRKSLLGVNSLNETVRNIVNPSGSKPEIKYGKEVYRIGDKVMVQKNNYLKGVFNGDIGVVVGADKTGIDIDVEGEIVRYERDELNEISLAYASTVHKAQGSEFPFAVVICSTSHFIMLQRNLLYTAVTRAKKRLYLVYQPKALKIAVSNDKIADRYSLLRERLRD